MSVGEAMCRVGKRSTKLRSHLNPSSPLECPQRHMTRYESNLPQIAASFSAFLIHDFLPTILGHASHLHCKLIVADL